VAEEASRLEGRAYRPLVPGLTADATRAGPTLVALGLYTAGVAVLGRGLWPRLNDSMIGPMDGDNFWFAWSLWEFKHTLLAGEQLGYTHDVQALAGAAYISTVGFFDQLLGVPLQLFLSPMGAYDVTVVLGFVLSGLTMYLLASAFTRNWIACFVAGLVFSFSAYHFGRAAGHLGLATMQFLPLCAWLLIRFARRPGVGSALLAGVGVGLVPWSDVYYVPYFLLPFGVLFLAGVAVRDWRWFTRPANLALGALAIGVAALVAAPSLMEYATLNAGVGAAVAADATDWERRIYSANLLGFFLPDPFNPLLGTFTARYFPEAPGFPERTVFLGWAALLFAALALLLRDRRRVALAWLAVGAVGGVLALGPNLRAGSRILAPLPFYDLVYAHSLLDNFRAPNRLSVLALLAVSVMAAIGITALLARTPERGVWRPAVAAAVLGVSLLGLLPSTLFSYRFPSAEVATPDLYRQMAAAPDDGLVMDIPPRVESVQYFQVVHGKRLATGITPRELQSAETALENVPYFSLFNSGRPLPASDVDPASASADIYPLPRFVSGLRQNHISYVVLHRYFCPDPALWVQCYTYPTFDSARRFLVSAAGQPFYDNAREGLVAWHVPPAPPPPPPALRFQLGAGWVPDVGVLSDGEPERVTSASATLLIDSSSARQGDLQLRAFAYARPMRLEVWLDGALLQRVKLDTGQPLDLDFGQVALRAGTNALDLRSLDGCVVANDLDPRNYDPDTHIFSGRCTSFGVTRVDVGA
jgi:hypothetical protein